ncbi:NTPase KAP family P-loop domain-containing protein 1-like [Ambystoma mexicanum]|uniref:NTPase KAP family P-loop domain-containing protein 1-like n=1 Tax=Ambystoma mexicanum TaxID=8296 RepID=UPI0037E77B9C
MKAETQVQMNCPGSLETDEDVYCQALANSLYYVATPVTVGFYAPWGRHENTLLDKVQQYLKSEASKRNEKLANTGEKTRNISGWHLIWLLLLMVFFDPVLKKKPKERKYSEYIFIAFSAWEFTGSDQIWAGLITTLCDSIERQFGILLISIYRVVRRKKKGTKEEPSEREWKSKMIICLPLWLATILVIVLAVGIIILLIVVGFPTGDGELDPLAVFESVGAAVVGVSAVAAIRGAAPVIRNMVITQRGQVERKMNRSDVSAQLGFMSAVKKEVVVITRFIKLMEIFQRKKIRVVLQITNLDKCAPDKVVGVLNAMNILLSDQDAPFISILAVDPHIIVDCVESSRFMRGMANNGYDFLNRIITLPFSVPKMDWKTKHLELQRLIDGEVDLSDDSVAREPPAQTHINNNSANQDEAESCIPLMFSNHEKGHITYMLIQDALKCLLKSSMHEYISDNVIHIKRIVNTISITIRLMVRKVPNTLVDPKKVASWVLLANQWPCRLSWILQCIEDEQQKRSLPAGGKGRGDPSFDDTSLLDVFENSLEELNLIKSDLKNLLELDGDPELFHKFLQRGFTVKDANFHLPFTVNLDFSLKRRMELLRGSNSLQGTKNINRLTALSVVRMTVEDVCKVMDKLDFIKENVPAYKDKLRQHNLNGRALVYSDNCEIKEVLGMGLGEWTIFSIYFLGVTPQVGSSATASIPHGRPENLMSGACSRENLLKRSMSLTRSMEVLDRNE